MKISAILLVLTLFTVGCKKKVTEDNQINIKQVSNKEANSDSIINNEDLNHKSANKMTQLNVLISAEKPKTIVLEKHILKENDKTILDFHYPVLNEEINSNFSNFNSHVKNELVEKNISLMRENEAYIPLCDSVITRKQKSKIDYSIKENRNILSAVFVIENFYSEPMRSNLNFQTINYNFNTGKIINFEGYFKPNSGKTILNLLNKIITSNINSGDMYYDCWEISEEDFKTYKNNFTIDNNQIRFYFDDCIVCPAYTGTYFIETTKEQLRNLIQDHYLYNKSNDLVL